MKDMKNKLKNLVTKGLFGAVLTCSIGSNEIASTVALTTGGAIAAGGVAKVYVHATEQAAKTNGAKVNAGANNVGGGAK